VRKLDRIVYELIRLGFVLNVVSNPVQMVKPVHRRVLPVLIAQLQKCFFIFALLRGDYFMTLVFVLPHLLPVDQLPAVDADVPCVSLREILLEAADLLDVLQRVWHQQDRLGELVARAKVVLKL
jgi:hypothetical protein